MSICVAVTDNDEGRAALDAATHEAALLQVPLVVVNLTANAINTARVSDGVSSEVIDRDPRSQRDEVEEVLDALDARPDVSRLVVGVRRRSPIGKAVLGSIAQRLILEASVPVLAVKATDG